ncbi:hypothetical protein ACUSIJ_20475 [Pseudochelatococcus sp. B33]
MNAGEPGSVPAHPARLHAVSADRAAAVRVWAGAASLANVFNRFEASARRVAGSTKAFAFVLDPASGWPLDIRDVARVTREFRSEAIEVRLHTVIDRLDSALAGCQREEERIGEHVVDALPDTDALRLAWEADKRKIHAALGAAAGIIRTNRLLTEKLPQSAYTEALALRQVGRAAAFIAHAGSTAEAFGVRLRQGGVLSGDSSPPERISCAATCPASE